MKPLSKYGKIFLGACAASGAITYFYLISSNKKVYASIPVSYESPSYCKWDDNWDHRNPKYVAPDKLKNEKDNNDVDKKAYVRHLILIRHGQYNTKGECDDFRNLTQKGRIQAEFTAKRLKELGFPYHTMVKSTMKRAQETGSIISEILPKVPVQHCDFLREGAPIPPEPPIRHWDQEMSKFFVDGARIEAAFRKYFYRGNTKMTEESYTILVCHANVIRYFVCRALQWPPESWLRMSLNHASITWISIMPSGRVILRVLGDSGHIPPEFISSK